MKLEGLAETAAVSLIFKAAETGLDFPLVTDLQAVRIMRELDYEFPPVSGSIAFVAQLATACSSRLVRDLVSDVEGRVINLGCGFDTQGIRHDKDEWFDVDCAEIMKMRGDCIPDTGTNSYNMIGDITDREFIDSMKEDMPTTVLLEGVLDYYTDKEVRGILSNIRDLSPDTKVIFNACGSAHRGVNPAILSSIGNDSVTKWGLDDPTVLEELGYEIESCTSITEVDDIRWDPIKQSLGKRPLLLKHATKVVEMKRI